MSGQLAPFLCTALAGEVGNGWEVVAEYPLLPRQLERRVGYMPKADLLLLDPGGRRIAVELEISRADPVANQAKMLLAYEYGALRRDDGFVSLLSSHLQPGRRNLAALFTRHMRGLGLPAFSVSLLPFLSPPEIQRLNQGSPAQLEDARLPVRDELRRVLDVVSPRGERDHRIHFAGEISDVLANLWTWNDAMDSSTGLSWANRRTQYWVADPRTGLFAPSKFCAFIPAARPDGPKAPATMTVEVYETLGEQDPRFDGHVARQHLEGRLGFRLLPIDYAAAAWATWRARLGERIALRGAPALLVPPAWWT
jgi:hypothetical protein